MGGKLIRLCTAMALVVGCAHQKMFEAKQDQPAAQPAAAAAPASRGAAGMDQETFDRVLQEQLDKGVDRRVAEGRARAAAVVAARKKEQG